MIVREENDKLILTRQHDHARLSGEIARHFEHYFTDDLLFADALFAIYEHDRSWILPDAVPKWNATKDRPFDFIDYPLPEKLDYYRLGLEETEKLNPYAGLLCSMHYTSFINNDTTDSESREFLQEEQKRQSKLRTELKITEDGLLHKHFQLLQLCDNLSLYLCLNRPGVDKADEHFFFIKGFKNSSSFNPVDGKDLLGKWPNKEEVTIIPFPFQAPFEVSIEQRHLSKDTIHQNGLEDAYLQAEIKPLKVRFSEA